MLCLDITRAVIGRVSVIISRDLLFESTFCKNVLIVCDVAHRLPRKYQQITLPHRWNLSECIYEVAECSLSAGEGVFRGFGKLIGTAQTMIGQSD